MAKRNLLSMNNVGIVVESLRKGLRMGVLFFIFLYHKRINDGPNYKRIFLAEDNEDDQLIFREAVENVAPPLLLKLLSTERRH